MQEWNIYRGLNRHTPIMHDPFSRTFLFLSFIKGEKVQEWTQEQLRWVVDYVAGGPGREDHEYIWDTVSNVFFHAFTNITREVDAQTDIKDLKMKGEQGLDNYITSFERLAHLGRYNTTDQAVIDMFIDGLPPLLAINIAKFDTPQSYDDWKRGAICHHTAFTWIKSKFCNKGQRTHPTLDQWKKAFQKKQDKDAMDTTLGHVRARATNTRVALSEKDRAELMAAGKCFHCKKQGHMSKNCPDKPAQARSTPDDSSEDKAIQATTSKPTNPFLTTPKKKTTAQDIIRMITEAEDDVKDTIIQEVFMKQDF